MAQYTPNLNLYKPDASDPFGEFREKFNDNMDILDNGGGGGSGGHTIYDKDGNALAQESGLQVTGNVNVSDDSGNGRTVVDILGGGGNVYGFAIDESRKLFEGTMTNFTQTLEYTATEDAIALVDYSGSNGTNQWLLINGVIIPFQVLSSGRESFTVPIRKGDKISARHSSDNESCYFHLVCYGIKQGTNGIYAPVIYSDNERVIGVWRDNKPLYQKTFLFHSTDSQGNYVFQDVSSLNIDSCVEIKGTCDRNVAGLGAIIYDMNSFESNQYQTYLGYSAFNGKIQYTIKLPVGETTTWQVITIRYTKTTDVAGSGNWNTDGVPTHHYSTSEQVIGTWTNGKPLYERTFDFNNQVIPDNTWTNNILGGNLPTIQIKSYDGYFGLENTDWSANFNYIRNNDGGFNEFFTSNSTGSDISVRPNMNAGVNVVLRTCVVRYTKSTD